MKYVLVSSNGTEIDYTIYNTETEAEKALKDATEYYTEGKSEDDLECSWVGEDSAYLCPVDTSIGEDWYWDIITIDETSDAIEYLLQELEFNKKLIKDNPNDHDQTLVSKARIITILNVLEKLGYDISEDSAKN